MRAPRRGQAPRTAPCRGCVSTGLGWRSASWSFAGRGGGEAAAFSAANVGDAGLSETNHAKARLAKDIGRSLEPRGFQPRDGVFLHALPFTLAANRCV